MLVVRGRLAGNRVGRWRAGGIAASATLALSMVGGVNYASAQEPGVQSVAPSPIAPADPQQWMDQADMTWDDYKAVRPEEWNSAETSQGSEIQYQTAVILVDFEDQPFLITQEPESHPFGNPQSGWQPVAPAEVDEWFSDYFTNPNNPYNGGQTLHSYWMEDSHGRIGVDVEVFGPYTLPGKLHEYGYSGFNSPRSAFCPQGDDCTKSIRQDGGDAWRADIGCDTALCGFDNGFYVSAGHDESSTWEEFGQMLFAEPDDVPDELGPPRDENGNPPLDQNGNVMPNWTTTRYVPWTSWRAGANHWPNAGGGTSTQAESSGQSVFAHEFSHLRGLPDNYNNPFADNTRNFTGYWEMMSRGTFNGPGGTHNRWQIPNAGGSALGPHHMVHFKQALDVLDAQDQVVVDRSQLLTEGIAVGSIKARSDIPNGEQVAFEVNLDGDGYQEGQCEATTPEDPEFWCPDGTNWQSFTMEVVDRVGNDSFVPGHGVLLAQSRGPGSPDVWMIDANPQFLERVDYFRPRPDGTLEPVMVVRGDPRQLDDASFHAGTNSGSAYEYVDQFNKLHFYVLDAYRDASGVLFYDLAVRNLDGAGDFARDGSLGAATNQPVGGSTALLTVPLTNTGEAGDGVFGSDVYRISSSVAGDGWSVSLPYEVRAAAAGETVSVPVYATAGVGASESATVTVTATSEADPDVTVSLEIDVTSADLKVTFDSAAALVDSYYAAGALDRSERQTLLAHLTVAERTSGRAAEMALDRFVGVAEAVADVGARNLASAALVSVAGDLRSEL